MSNIPLTAFDFIAVLSSGSIMVITLDFLFGFKFILKDTITSPILFIFIILSYIFGHVISNLAQNFLESIVVKKILQTPSYHLLQKSSSKKRFVFPNYFRELPPSTVERIKEMANLRGFSYTKGEPIFLHAFSILSQNKEILSRLDGFRNMYGFSRNVSLSLFLSSLLLLIFGFPEQNQEILLFSSLLLFLSINMFYVYLKFYRQYTYHLFVTYSEYPLENRPEAVKD